MKLADLQRAFQAYLLHGTPDIGNEIARTAHAGAETRLDIYANAYRLRLNDALKKDFPALHRLLGEHEFAQRCQDYLAAHPSRHFSLRHAGAHLSGHLAQCGDARASLLAELAQFEWMLLAAFDASDVPAVAPAAVARVPAAAWPALRFSPHPSLMRLDLAWNAPGIRMAVDQGAQVPAPEQAVNTRPWLVWRQDFQVCFRSLGADESAGLTNMIAGGDFAEICEALAVHLPAEAVPQQAAIYLKRWLTDGLIRAIHVGA